MQGVLRYLLIPLLLLSSLHALQYGLILDNVSNSTFTNVTILNATNTGVWMANSSSNNTLSYSSILTLPSSLALRLDLYGVDNLIYQNQFLGSGTYINNQNAANQFNISINGVAQGNQYADILSYGITDSNNDGYGDSGIQYPYNASLPRWQGFGADWGPITSQTTGAFIIQTNPSGANVLIKNGPIVVYQGISPYSVHNVQPGTYVAQLSKDGYSLLTRFLYVYSNQTTLLNVTLTPLVAINGSFIVTTSPQGVQITVSRGTDVYSGLSPLQVGSTAPGIYLVSASKYGYVPASGHLSVDTGRLTSYNLTLNPIPTPTSLLVDASPSGANVWVIQTGNNGAQYNGTAPLLIPSIEAGNYSIQASASGYRSNATLFEVLPNQANLLNMTLTPYTSSSSITVNTIPSGANVSVRSMKNLTQVYSGPSPFTVSNLGVFGTYILSATLPGYGDYVATPAIWDNQSYVFNYALSHIPVGSFNASAYDPLGFSLDNALITIHSANGSIMSSTGSSYFASNVRTGTCQVTITADGYQTNASTLIINENQTSFANFTLYPSDPTGFAVYSTPSNASVSIRPYSNSGVILYSGTTPMRQYGVAPGRYIIQYQRAGYSSNLEFFNVASGQLTMLNYSLIQATSPPPSGGEFGSFQINTIPTGANVSVQGATSYNGISPFSQSNVRSGSYALYVSMDGYVMQAGMLEVDTGQNKELNFTLQPIPSSQPVNPPISSEPLPSSQPASGEPVNSS